MAARKSNASKPTPAVRYLRYQLTNSATPGTETSHFIDLARDLSRVNRRLYRAGRDYHVKKISIVSSNTIQGLYPGAAPGSLSQQNAGRISVSTAPDSWVARGAWNRAYKSWVQMNKTASGQLAGNIAGTWADFKIFLSADMAGATLPSPLDNGGNAVGAALNWDVSTFVTPDGTTTDDEFYGTLLGDHVGAAGARTSIGLIRSYAESRATVQLTDPNVPSTASTDPLVNLFDYGTTIDDVIDNLEDENDAPPYQVVTYAGGSTNMPKPIVIQDTTIVDGRASMAGFSALMGHLEFEIKSPLASDVYSVLIELAPGNYRGIKAGVI
jgi:hypothetical protein